MNYWIQETTKKTVLAASIALLFGAGVFSVAPAWAAGTPNGVIYSNSDAALIISERYGAKHNMPAEVAHQKLTNANVFKDNGVPSDATPARAPERVTTAQPDRARTVNDGVKVASQKSEAKTLDTSKKTTSVPDVNIASTPSVETKPAVVAVTSSPIDSVVIAKAPVHPSKFNNVSVTISAADGAAVVFVADKFDEQNILFSEMATLAIDTIAALSSAQQFNLQTVQAAQPAIVSPVALNTIESLYNQYTVWVWTALSVLGLLVLLGLMKLFDLLGFKWPKSHATHKLPTLTAKEAAAQSLLSVTTQMKLSAAQAQMPRTVEPTPVLCEPIQVGNISYYVPIDIARNDEVDYSQAEKIVLAAAASIIDSASSKDTVYGHQLLKQSFKTPQQKLFELTHLEFQPQSVTDTGH